VLLSIHLIRTTAISLPTLFRGRGIACSENKKLRLCCRVDQTPRQIKDDLACRLKRPWVCRHRIIMGLKKVSEENIQPLQGGFGGKGVFIVRSLFCDHFAHKFICKRLRLVRDYARTRCRFLPYNSAIPYLLTICSPYPIRKHLQTHTLEPPALLTKIMKSATQQYPCR